jgi:hypothetical protein
LPAKVWSAEDVVALVVGFAVMLFCSRSIGASRAGLGVR